MLDITTKSHNYAYTVLNDYEQFDYYLDITLASDPYGDYERLDECHVKRE